MTDLSPAFITQYEAEFELALQQNGSKLRDRVRVKNNVVGSAVRFPVIGVSNSTKNRPVATALVGDQDQPNSNVTATLNRYESWRIIDQLQEFMTNVDERSAYTQAVVKRLGRDMDTEILSAASSSNLSMGASAAMNMALVAAVNAEVHQQNWAETEEWTWAVSPAVWGALTQIQQFGSRNYNDGTQLPNGGNGAVTFMGFNFVMLSALGTSTYWNSSTDHNTYVIAKSCLGLGIGQDIKPLIERRQDLNATQVLGSMSAGAVTIQADGVLKVGINGLTATV